MNVTLGTEGINYLIDYFTRMQDDIDGVVKEVEKALADEGYQLMLVNAPTRAIDGNQVGHVRQESYKDGYRIVYEGEDVAYIEFGTGYIGDNNPYSDFEALDMVNWQYDVNGHGVNGWFYRSQQDGQLKHSRGMAPQMPVYKSFTQLRERAVAIIKEVFNAKFGS